MKTVAITVPIIIPNTHVILASVSAGTEAEAREAAQSILDTPDLMEDLWRAA